MSGTAGHALREGGPDVFKRGSLKRRLPGAVISKLSTSDESGPTTAQTVRLLLKNLNADLKLHIAASVVSAIGNVPIRPSQVPAGAATIQLIPKIIPPDGNPQFLRPVFQDPALAQNQNHPLAQDLPFGWEFSTNTDEVEIEIIVTPLLFAGTNLVGNIIVMVDIEYDGVWWDTKAMQYAISQVQLTSVSPFAVLTSV
jgi:hypothetical protein